MRAILVAWPVTFLPSILLAAAAAWLFPEAAKPEFHVSGMLAVVLLVIFSPLVETLMMAAVLAVLLRLMPPLAAILVSSLGWGLAHSSMAASWGLVIWWPFLVFSTLFVVWRERSLPLALAIPFAVHALQNLAPALAIAFGMKI